VLCAQRSDWRIFRESQQRLRVRYRNKSFSIFVDEVRKRRRRHGLDDNVHLLLDSQQQSRQQNWIEFQDHHLKRHEWQKKKRDELQKDLDDAQNGAGDTDIEGFERAAQHERAIQQRLEYAERTLRWHEVILLWIEQQRFAMDPRPPTPVEKGSSDQNALPKAVRRASIRQRRSERPNTPAVLGKVRVLKPTPKSQNIRTQTFKATTSKPITVGTIPNSTQQMPKRREIKPRRAKETALGQFRPQRVTMANRFADTGAKSRSGTQCSGVGQTRDSARPQRRSAPQQSHPAPGIVKPRSKRISRPPVRWAPE